MSTKYQSVVPVYNGGNFVSPQAHRMVARRHSPCGRGVFGSDPSRRDERLTRLSDRRDIARCLSRAERCPCRHQPSSLLEQIAAAIGGFGLVTYGMG